MTPPRSPVGGPAPRQRAEESFEGVCDLVDGKAMVLNDGSKRSADLEFILRHRWVGKRVRVTLVELLPEPPTDGRTSAEANYDPMTAPVPEGDMNGPHGEIPPSSEVGRR